MELVLISVEEVVPLFVDQDARLLHHQHSRHYIVGWSILRTPQMPRSPTTETYTLYLVSVCHQSIKTIVATSRFDTC